MNDKGRRKRKENIKDKQAQGKIREGKENKGKKRERKRSENNNVRTVEKDKRKEGKER